MLSRGILSRPFIWIALGTASILAGLLGIACWQMAQLQGVPVEVGWKTRAIGTVRQVAAVDSGGPADGKLFVGDRVIAINGSSQAAKFGGFKFVPGKDDLYSLDVVRNGRPVRLSLTLRKTPTRSWNSFSYLVLASIDFALAIWIGLARPDYPAGQVAFFLFVAIARTLTTQLLQDFPTELNGVALWVSVLFRSRAWRPLEWALALDFALRFPEPIKKRRGLTGLQTGLYLCAVLLFVFTILPELAELSNASTRSAFLPKSFPLAAFDRLRPLFADSLGVIALGSAPFIFAAKYRNLDDPLARRRLAWVALGISMAVASIAIEVLTRLVLTLSGHPGAAVRAENFLDPISTFFSTLAPVTVTYAIVKHRILGIRLVIRKGVQYLLAKNVLRVLLYLPLIAIAVHVALHPKEGLHDLLLGESWWFYLALAGTACLSLLFRRRARQWVDTKFFRSAYEEEAILSEPIDRMQICETSDEVARIVATKLEAGLHPCSVAVLIKRDSGSPFTVGYSQGSPIALQLRGRLDEEMQHLVQMDRSARTFSEITTGLQKELSTSCEELRRALVSPINGSDGQLLGVLLMGEKRSEEPYSNRDRRLLQAVAIQMGLVLEMLVLKERLREEGRVRVEVLGHLDHERIQLLLECPICGRCYSSPAKNCKVDESRLTMTLPVELVIESKYRLERRIGSGGMGAVYEATDLRLDRTVAVKVMTGRLFGNHSALRRFEREARAAARLQHPNIVPIHDFGSLRGDGAYLVMQRIAGRSWREQLARNGPIPPVRAARWFDQLCEAIICAHNSGVIHRDIKPENILVSEDANGQEVVTVLDFGLAKLYTLQKTVEPELTTGEAILGTYGYMSPEQRKGAQVDTRTDVFAIGVVAVEVLTNTKPPSAGASRRWLHDVLCWIQATAATADLTQFLDKCLAESPRDRVESVQALQRALVPLLSQCPPLLISKSAAAGGTDTVTMPGI